MSEEGLPDSSALTRGEEEELVTRLLAMLRQLVETADYLSPARRQALAAALDTLPSPDAITLPPDEAPEKRSPAWQTSLGRQAERIGRLAEHLAILLSDKSGVPIDMTGYLASEARARVVLSLLEAADDDALLAYFTERKTHGLLDADTLLNHAALGSSRVFFAALAAAVDLAVDIEMVAAFIEDGGITILERLLLRTEISETAREAIMQAYRSACGEP
ncbi:MAG: hypothetical protein D6740_06265 [Alphaproteobacteria bacterium]|nr:MAG: hypothetical protein D6740_06265 [Alphaproteobacteria bacterium]